ncbi:MAG TPA: Ig-like domain-containing protein [Candidatus Krumholzibacteria bacterium]|nr:Ig-like domain-containing protein [Candidatus Krumholzibacteria bacterium]
MLRQNISIILLACAVALPGPAGAQAAKRGAETANRTAAATSTRILLFNVPPAASYDVRQNGTSVASLNAGPAGSVSFDGSTSPGDAIAFLLTGIDPVTPSAPGGFVATGSTDGCVQLTWNTPVNTEYVTDFSLLWGPSAGVYTDSLHVDHLEIVHNGAVSFSTQCGFANGTYVFALRAHNSFDLWSGLSAASTTTISNENTQGPPPPANVAVAENPAGCAHVTWTSSSDPSVVGYRVYRGTRPRAQGAYVDSTDVGLANSVSFCELAAGTYYLAVRARTTIGVMSGYSKEVSLNLVGPDVTPPVISQLSPPDGTTGVARNTTVFFVVSDARSGVDASSIDVRLNGQPCDVTHTAIPGGTGYAVQCSPSGELAANTLYQVTVSASDNADPENMATAASSFTTGANSVNDIDPPVFSGATPSNGAVEVLGTTPVEVTISDSGLGVDFQSIVMTIDGAPVGVEVSGTPASARISHQPAAPFAGGRTIRVTVEGCDRAGTPNCAVPLSFEFTVASPLAAVAAPGAIVPNGFWANDPARPMEIRDLPPAWDVRIFDAAGTPVRRFQNKQGSAYTWTWDFRNDGGQRVAPALYLVRVTDGAGSVREAGRFLVQADR